MSTRAESSGGLVTGSAATLALAAAGWLALGLTTPSPQPPRTEVGRLTDLTDTTDGGSAWSSPSAYPDDRTQPTLHPEARPAVVVQGARVVLIAHGADDGSGVAGEACQTGRLPGVDRLGVHTVTCMVRDRAGNLATARTTYRVISKVGARKTRP